MNAALHKYVYHKPLWLTMPKVLQLELHNYCNLKCQYCNAEDFCMGKHGVAKRAMVEAVIQQSKGVVEARLFMNNEPLIVPAEEEISLPEALRLAKKTLQCRTIIYTNGTIIENKDLLVNRDLDEVHFTISSCGNGSYKKVHGAPLFHKALETYFHVLTHKKPNQKIYVHFVMVKDNLADLAGWRNLFKDSSQIVSPLHTNLDQPASKQCISELTDYPATVQEGTLKGKMAADMPCTCWDNQGVSCFGDLLQCCNAVYSLNHGQVGQVSVKQAWQRKLQNRMNNTACQSCNLKRHSWRRVLDENLQ